MKSAFSFNVTASKLTHPLRPEQIFAPVTALPHQRYSASQVRARHRGPGFILLKTDRITFLGCSCNYVSISALSNVSVIYPTVGAGLEPWKVKGVC